MVINVTKHVSLSEFWVGCQNYSYHPHFAVKCICVNWKKTDKLNKALIVYLDIDECEEAGGLMCSHYCSNSIGSYTCYCPVGMTTNGDMQTCQGVINTGTGTESFFSFLLNMLYHS